MKHVARDVKPPKRHNNRPSPDGRRQESTLDATWLRVSPSPAEFEAASPGAEALSTEVGINLLHVRDLVWGRLDRLVRHHAIPSPTGFLILTILDGAVTPLPPHVIAERMLLTAGTMTGLIATLEKHGYVSTEPTPGRGRRVLIRITHEGRRVRERAVRELDPEVVRWFECLDKDEKLSLLSLLGKLGMHLRASRA